MAIGVEITILKKFKQAVVQFVLFVLLEYVL